MYHSKVSSTEICTRIFFTFNFVFSMLTVDNAPMQSFLLCLFNPNNRWRSRHVLPWSLSSAPLASLVSHQCVRAAFISGLSEEDNPENNKEATNLWDKDKTNLKSWSFVSFLLLPYLWELKISPRVINSFCLSYDHAIGKRRISLFHTTIFVHCLSQSKKDLNLILV